MHHGVQQLDRGVKVVLLAILTAQVWDANLQVQYFVWKCFSGELPTRFGVQRPTSIGSFVQQAPFPEVRAMSTLIKRVELGS